MYIFKMYMEKQKTQKRQHDTEGEEQSWRTDTIWSQDYFYSNQK